MIIYTLTDKCLIVRIFLHLLEVYYLVVVFFRRMKFMKEICTEEKISID